MWRSLHDAWWRLATQHQPRTFSDAVTARLLSAGSLAYGAAVAWRNAGYDRRPDRAAALPCPVISIGNVTVGGTGKTVCVELIARKLLARGKRVAVLSRGYGGLRREYWLQWVDGRLTIDGAAVPAGSPDGLLADEPQLLARCLPRVPVVIGGDRVRAGLAACRRFSPDVILLDDGFQHRRLARALDVVLVRAGMPLGGWALLPRGPMREPLEALARAHVVVITKADEALEMLAALQERVRCLNPQATVIAATHEPSDVWDPLADQAQPPGALRGRRVGAVSSIGDPAGFEATLRRLEAHLMWHEALPDHHRYQADDLAVLKQRLSAQRPDVVVTTEKDWMRLQSWTEAIRSWPAPLRVLRVRMAVLSGEGALDDRLDRVCAG